MPEISMNEYQQVDLKTPQHAGSSAHASGVPGSLDHLLPQYGFLVFAIGALSSWPASNNAAIFAEVPHLCDLPH